MQIFVRIYIAKEPGSYLPDSMRNNLSEFDVNLVSYDHLTHKTDIAPTIGQLSMIMLLCEVILRGPRQKLHITRYCILKNAVPLLVWFLLP